MNVRALVFHTIAKNNLLLCSWTSLQRRGLGVWKKSVSKASIGADLIKEHVVKRTVVKKVSSHINLAQIPFGWDRTTMASLPFYELQKTTFAPLFAESRCSTFIENLITRFEPSLNSCSARQTI